MLTRLARFPYVGAFEAILLHSKDEATTPYLLP